MADDAATTTEDTQITFNVKAANDQKHVLTLAQPPQLPTSRPSSRRRNTQMFPPNANA